MILIISNFSRQLIQSAAQLETSAFLAEYQALAYLIQIFRRLCVSRVTPTIPLHFATRSKEPAPLHHLCDPRSHYSTMKNPAPARSQEAQKPEDSAQSNPASISDPPSANQKILHDGKTYTTIKEGLAYVLIPPDAPLSQDPSLSKGEGPAQSVFYNPIQQYNRDLTVLAIRAFGEAHVAEKLAKASELRAKRQKKASNRQGKKQNKHGKANEAAAQDPKNKRKLDETAVEAEAEQPAAKKSKANRDKYVLNPWRRFGFGSPGNLHD